VIRLPKKKSLGSNPLGSKRTDPVLRDMLRVSPLPPPTALVLSGRGAEAAFEVGVVAGLAAAEGFDSRILTGVSVGAFNAAILAGHDGPLDAAAARLRGLWLDRVSGDGWTGRNGLYRVRGDLRPLLDPSRFPGAVAGFVDDGTHWLRDALRHGARALRSGDDMLPRLLWLADLGSILSLEPFQRLVAAVVDLEALRRSPRHLRVATAHWVTGRLEQHDGATLAGASGHDRIVAAAARPGIFPCVEIGGAPQVEATAFATSDLGPALEAGARQLHVPVFLAPRADGDRPASTIDAFDRMLAELQLARLQRELGELRGRAGRPPTVHLYRGQLGPSESHGFLDLRRDRVAALIEHGREVAARHDCRASGCLVVQEPAGR
jgi:predicted acylesterase/phospholipase RssA